MELHQFGVGSLVLTPFDERNRWAKKNWVHHKVSVWMVNIPLWLIFTKGHHYFKMQQVCAIPKT